MVDCWAALSIHPYVHLPLTATPIFRLWIGVTEYVLRSCGRLGSAVHAAVHDTGHRSDDLEFIVAACGWSQCVSLGSFEVYRRRFVETMTFFDSRFEEAGVVGGNELGNLSNRSCTTPRQKAFPPSR
jgi:prephenate dehydrogenase (NADP+)